MLLSFLLVTFLIKLSESNEATLLTSTSAIVGCHDRLTCSTRVATDQLFKIFNFSTTTNNAESSAIHRLKVKPLYDVEAQQRIKVTLIGVRKSNENNNIGNNKDNGLQQEQEQHETLFVCLNKICEFEIDATTLSSNFSWLIFNISSNKLGLFCLDKRFYVQIIWPKYFLVAKEWQISKEKSSPGQCKSENFFNFPPFYTCVNVDIAHLNSSSSCPLVDKIDKSDVVNRRKLSDGDFLEDWLGPKASHILLIVGSVLFIYLFAILFILFFHVCNFKFLTPNIRRNYHPQQLIEPELINNNNNGNGNGNGNGNCDANNCNNQGSTNTSNNNINSHPATFSSTTTTTTATSPSSHDDEV